MEGTEETEREKARFMGSSGRVKINFSVSLGRCNERLNRDKDVGAKDLQLAAGRLGVYAGAVVVNISVSWRHARNADAWGPPWSPSLDSNAFPALGALSGVRLHFPN